MKSETTASSGIPAPAIRIPVWPVARKSTSCPRRRNSRASISAVYFLPSAQSVPTVSRRLPVRLRPDAIGMPAGGRRTSMSRRPKRRAAASSSRLSDRRACIPLTISRPVSSASISAGIHSAFSVPPRLATPMTSDCAPRAYASAGFKLGRPVVTVAPGNAYSPTHFSGAQSRRPKAVFAYGASVMSPRNSRYGPGTSTVIDVPGSVRRSAEAVAKEVPVVEDDQEGEHGNRCERVVHARTECPCTRAPDADREPAREQGQRDRQQRQREREIQRGRNLVDQAFEAAGEDCADDDDEEHQQYAAQRQRRARPAQLTERAIGASLADGADEDRDEQQHTDADDEAVQLARVVPADPCGNDRREHSHHVRGEATLVAFECGHCVGVLHPEHTVADFDPAGRVAEDVAHQQRAVRHRRNRVVTERGEHLLELRVRVTQRAVAAGVTSVALGSVSGRLDLRQLRGKVVLEESA